MTDQQLFFLCGTIALCAGSIANSLNLAIFAIVCFFAFLALLYKQIVG
jgi:hypothetical protein